MHTFKTYFYTKKIKVSTIVFFFVYFSWSQFYFFLYFKEGTFSLASPRFQDRKIPFIYIEVHPWLHKSHHYFAWSRTSTSKKCGKIPRHIYLDNLNFFVCFSECEIGWDIFSSLFYYKVLCTKKSCSIAIKKTGGMEDHTYKKQFPLFNYWECNCKIQGK